MDDWHYKTYRLLLRQALDLAKLKLQEKDNGAPPDTDVFLNAMEYLLNELEQLKKPFFTGDMDYAVRYKYLDNGDLSPSFWPGEFRHYSEAQQLADDLNKMYGSNREFFVVKRSLQVVEK